MLTFFHTAKTNEPLFSSLLDEIAPDIPARHVTDETILPYAREYGVNAQLQQRVTDTILEAVEAGSDVVLCTCSTIGACAENVQPLTDKTVQRVDRAMAECAVSIGSRIIIAASLSSTLPPTRELVLDAAAKAGKEIELVEVFCASAWPKFEAGDRDGYFAEIATELRQVEGDVIVLAQASMAGAAALCADLPIPVLSSPRLGLEAAVTAYRLATNK